MVVKGVFSFHLRAAGAALPLRTVDAVGAVDPPAQRREVQGQQADDQDHEPH
jgi:hypothetical protein